MHMRKTSGIVGCLTWSLVLAMGCQAPAPQPVGEAHRSGSAAMLSNESPKGTVGSETAAGQPAGPGYAAEEYRLVSRKDQIVSVLRNGLVVIARRVPSPVVAVRGYSFTGGVYEGKWLGGGLSHLLEHLVAGGSNGRRTEEQNKELLQAIGNNSNAYTEEDHTSFFVNTTPEHARQAVDLVTGWMFTAKITPDEYAREYQVVQRELEMGKGEPERQLFYMMAMNRYRVSPARVPVIGYQAVIQGLSRDDVYNYYRMAYVPNNMMFVVAGGLDPETMLKDVQRFSDYPPGREFSHDIAAEPPVTSPRVLAATFPRLGAAQVILSFPAVRIQSPDRYAMDLLAAIAGQGESSILTQDIRDKRQLVSAISADNEAPSYAVGSFDVMMELKPEQVPEATRAVLDMFESLKAAPLDEQRIARAKAMIRAAYLQRLQKCETIAEMIGDDFMTTGDADFSDVYLKRIDELKASDLQAAARKYFDPGKLITTAMFPADSGPAAGLPRAEDILRPAATTRPSAVATTEPAGEAKVERVVLDNGTVLLVKRIPTSPRVSVQMYSLGGLTAEDERTNGLGNLTMQMLLRGTTSRSARQIAEFFDSIGGTMDAVSGKNTWAWNAEFMNADLDKALAAYADVVNNPSFPEEESAALKQRIESQIAQEDADWFEQATRYFRKEFYGPAHLPYQFLPIGSAENVRSFTLQQMRDWYEHRVQAAPRVLAVYGDVDVEHVQRLAADLLGKGERRPEPHHPGLPLTRQAGQAAGAPFIDVARVAVQKTEQTDAGVIIGFKSDSVVGDPANYPLDVIDTLTSGFTYPTGYIFETLRGLGLVYMADAQNVPGRDAKLPGTFEAYAGCLPENVNRVVDLTLENIARVEGSPQDVNMEWFRRSKELMVVADAMEHETPAAQAQAEALDEVMGLGYDYHRHFADQVRRVTLRDVQETARQRLGECVITISTPRPDLVQVKPGVRTYRAFPPVDLAPKGVQHDAAAGGK